MSVSYQDWVRQIRALDNALGQLSSAATPLGVPALAEWEWYANLKHKLLPQTEGGPFLVVAIVGGTNIGKSAIFNHLAGERISASGPLASGTKHPVCLVPKGFDEDAGHDLSRLFEGFNLRAWENSDDPLQETTQPLLFWRRSEQVPPRLLLLDTPDIDSDSQVNWQRADLIRHAADVLVAVLTQQKYNDTAVKRFFRKAVEADKAIVVVFNQCELPDDEEYWPRWLDTFCRETGAQPELVYVAPYDRRAVEENRLPVWRMPNQAKSAAVVSSSASETHEPSAARAGTSGTSQGMFRGEDEASTLRQDLASLEFDAIKIRTSRGALAQIVDDETGAPAFLRETATASSQFREAWRALSAADLARVPWPALPTSLVVDEVRRWWHARRGPIPRRLHGFYAALGRGILWPARYAGGVLRREGADTLAEFQRRERACVLDCIEQLLGELDRLSQVGNRVLRDRLRRVLAGKSRVELLEGLRNEHEGLGLVDQELRDLIGSELERLTQANPRVVRLFRSLDWALALSRPAITVTLAVSGWALAGNVVSHAAADAAWQSVGHAAGHTTGQLLAEAAVTGGLTGGGEVVVEGTSQGLKRTAARFFHTFNEHYARRRAEWLSGFVERELLGPVLSELREGAQVVETEAFRNVERALKKLKGFARPGELPEYVVESQGSQSPGDSQRGGTS